MLNLQKYLQNNSIDSLRESPYNLKIMEEDPYVIFKYDMINSDLNDPIVCESRGIILETNTLEVACISFPKFFNYGESQAYDMDLSKATIYRKYDGSLIKIWYSTYYEEWRISTNGTINAFSVDIIEKSIINTNFGDLVIDTLEGVEGFRELTSMLNKEYSYSFELLHPQNIIVENHIDKKMILIGVRNNKTLEDYHITKEKFGNISILPNIYIAKTFEINKTSYETILEEASSFNTEDNIFEGFVVADVRDGLIHGRVKVKTPVYLKYHRLTDVKHSDNIFIDVFIQNEMSEFESYLHQAPSYAKERYFFLKEKYIKLIDDLTIKADNWRSYLKQIKESNPEKYKSEFGEEVQKRVHSEIQGFVFEHVYRGLNPKEYIHGMSSKKLKSLLNIY